MPVRDESVEALVAFAREAAGAPVMAIRGSVSTPVAIPVADRLAVACGRDGTRIDPATASERDVSAVAEALREEGARIEAGDVVLPLSGDLEIARSGDAVLVATVRRRRSDGRLSGAIDRLVLVSLRGAGR